VGLLLEERLLANTESQIYIKNYAQLVKPAAKAKAYAMADVQSHMQLRVQID